MTNNQSLLERCLKFVIEVDDEAYRFVRRFFKSLCECLEVG